MPTNQSLYLESSFIRLNSDPHNLKNSSSDFPLFSFSSALHFECAPTPQRSAKPYRNLRICRTNGSGSQVHSSSDNSTAAKKWHNAIVKSHKFPATALTFVRIISSVSVTEWLWHTKTVLGGETRFFNSIHQHCLQLKSDHSFNLVITLFDNGLQWRTYSLHPPSVQAGVDQNRRHWLNDLIAITIIIRAASQLMELENFRH